MKKEWLNEGKPFPEGHRKAGMIGLVLDFEDGRPDTQNVYAATAEEMLDKIATMYGNTQVRNGELKRIPPQSVTRINPDQPAPALTPKQGKMTADERMQAVADLGDPEKAPQAIIDLVRDGNGTDLAAEAADRASKARITAKEREVAGFMAATPEYVATANNAKLLRAATFARVGTEFTAADLTESFEELRDMGVLESQQPLATPTGEPSAPPPPAPRSSTGARPSSLGSGPRTVTAGPKLTRNEILAMAGTDEYIRRLKEETGFQALVNLVLS